VHPQVPGIVTALSWVYLVSMMFALGLELGARPKESKHEKWKLRGMILRGLVLGVVVLPALAVGLARAFHMNGPVAIALMLLVATSGGRYAPQFVKLAGVSDMSLAVELTMFAVKVTAITAPLTAAWALGHPHVHVHDLLFIAQLIVLQIVPVYLGKWLRRHHPEGAARMMKPANHAAVVTAVAAFIIVGIVGGREAASVVADHGWLLVILIAAASPLLGWLAGRGDREAQRAFAVMANARELGLALPIASVTANSPAVRAALFAVWIVFTLWSLAVAVGLRGEWRRRLHAPEKPA
jgi:BASS family bile acid:Na+ symporter